ncbi:hypothetical protein [Burkholderia pseudomallei]|uniref:hypothetical protein n=1 Tax=Burkholderia pseudomallei TaxID=28450 RepID=UPI00097649D0|nr:hypothetical protein [Burkholderia pseudomallei]
MRFRGARPTESTGRSSFDIAVEAAKPHGFRTARFVAGFYWAKQIDWRGAVYVSCNKTDCACFIW